MTDEEKKKSRREYQYNYYRAHKEKAKAYQRIYNLTHKKKKSDNPNRKSHPAWRRQEQSTSINYSALQRLDDAKFEKAFCRIVKGSLHLTTVKRKEDSQKKFAESDL